MRLFLFIALLGCLAALAIAHKGEHKDGEHHKEAGVKREHRERKTRSAVVAPVEERKKEGEKTHAKHGKGEHPKGRPHHGKRGHKGERGHGRKGDTSTAASVV